MSEELSKNFLEFLGSGKWSIHGVIEPKNPDSEFIDAPSQSIRDTFRFELNINKKPPDFIASDEKEE